MDVAIEKAALSKQSPQPRQSTTKQQPQQKPPILGIDPLHSGCTPAPPSTEAYGASSAMTGSVRESTHHFNTTKLWDEASKLDGNHLKGLDSAMFQCHRFNDCGINITRDRSSPHLIKCLSCSRRAAKTLSSTCSKNPIFNRRFHLRSERQPVACKWRCESHHLFFECICSPQTDYKSWVVRKSCTRNCPNCAASTASRL